MYYLLQTFGKEILNIRFIMNFLLPMSIGDKHLMYKQVHRWSPWHFLITYIHLILPEFQYVIINYVYYLLPTFGKEIFNIRFIMNYLLLMSIGDKHLMYKQVHRWSPSHFLMTSI